MTDPMEIFFLDELDFDRLVDKYWVTKKLLKIYLEEIHERIKEPVIIDGEGCC